MLKRNSQYHLTTRLERSEGLLIAPLLDIIFLVLLFFLFNINFEGVQSFDVHIPKAGNPDNAMPLSRVVVSVTQNEVLINGAEIKSDQFVTQLKNTLENAKTKQVLLLAAESLSYKEMVDIMDQVKEAGATAISLGVEKV